MQAEIIYARGLRVLIDGTGPVKGGWSFGESDDGMGLTVSELDGSPLKVGPHRLAAITFDRTWKMVNEECEDPEKMFLHLVEPDGSTKKVELAVVRTATEQYVTMVDGKAEYIDEISYYVRGSTEPVDAVVEIVDPLDEVGDWVVTARFPGMRKRDVLEILDGADLEDQYEINRE